MRLATRLRIVEAKLRPDDQEPRLVIVFDDGDGVWRDGQRNTIDPAAIDPRTQIIRFRLRLDGPQ